MMQTSALMSTKDFGSKFFGSTTVLKTFVNTLNSSPTRTSYPYDDTPNETTPERVWLSTNGSIIRCSSAIRLIHLSGLIATRRSSPNRVRPRRPRAVRRVRCLPDDDLEFADYRISAGIARTGG